MHQEMKTVLKKEGRPRTTGLQKRVAAVTRESRIHEEEKRWGGGNGEGVTTFSMVHLHQCIYF